jgi:hypothetical protein
MQLRPSSIGFTITTIAFAQLMSFCDKIQAPVLWDGVDGVHSTKPSFNEAQCVARLKEIYYSVFTSAGSDHPKMQKYHTCFASHLPPLHKQWDGTALHAYCIVYNESIIYLLHGSGCHPTIWRVKLAHGAAEMAPHE